MADYFLVLDGAAFENGARPTLAESWRRRSFRPCRDLAARLLPAARAYTLKYHAGETPPLLALVDGLSFDRATWRCLVAEILLFSAVDIPEMQLCAETLTRLLAPNHERSPGRRDQLASIQQAHVGSRDLTFGSAVYRPEHAGYNNAGDVARLADYLAAVRPESWSAAQLAGMEEIAAEDRDDELAFAREWFPVLAELFAQAQKRGQVIVHENIY